MLQVVKNYKTGELKIEYVPSPVLRSGGMLVRNAYSLISMGAERASVSTVQASPLGKARKRPTLSSR